VTDARLDWEARIGRRRAGSGDAVLPPPPTLHAAAGRGQVTLDWPAVAGAVGYQVYRSGAQGGFAPLDHGGGDVLAVPEPPYTDTSGVPGRTYRYRVAALSDVDSPGPPGPTAAAASTVDGAAAVTASVAAGATGVPLRRPWRRIIGSEHLSHLLSTETTGGRPIGAELAGALARVRAELGVESVRAHGILCDDLGVYREVDGASRYDFDRVDAVYDRLLELGLRPVVELSFMPRDLAADPSRTVFDYRAVVSPPKDWDRWADLIRALVTHLLDRYGRDEVRRWPFEVWNEANLEVFWSGTPEQFWRLYSVTARAVRDVDDGLLVGGPASAAAGWVADQLDTDAPLDFVSTHTYGSPPLDLRPLCVRYGRPDLPLLWTEWGVSPTHRGAVNDSVHSAPFLLRGMYSARGRIDALAYWVASDHFEELGRPQRLIHGGFGLLTVGNLAKPRYWALYLAERLGTTELPVRLTGDGAGGLVQAWASRHDDGRVSVLLWNGTLHQSPTHAPNLARTVRLDVDGLTAGAYQIRQWLVDDRHSNVYAAARGVKDWPDEAGWAALRERDRLAEAEPVRCRVDGAGPLGLEFELPMPGIRFVDLSPLGPGGR
jgi:xylan 1,4-beta-xylosidase